VRFAAAILAAVALAVLLGGSAWSARTDGGASWNLKPVSPTEKWLRVSVEGDTLYGFRLTGTGFTITGVKSVVASGGTAPTCSMSGTPPTLACDGALPGGINVFIHLETFGAAGSYLFAFLFQPGDTNLLFIPSQETPAPVPIGGTFGRTSPTAARFTIHNPGKQTFSELEVVPIGFAIQNVTSGSCAVTAGGALDCGMQLGPGKTAVIRAVTDPAPDGASIVLLAHGDQTGFADVDEGDACADLKAKLAEKQAEAVALRQQIATTGKALERAVAALDGVNAATAKRRIARAEKALKKLKRRLRTVEADIRARERHVSSCQGGGERSLAATTACDAEGNADAQARGRLTGLNEALAVQRTVAGDARAAIVLLKKAGGRGVRGAIARLTVLDGLPGKTQAAVATARRKWADAEEALASCEAALTQG
jgi:hypothetical protein